MANKRVEFAAAVAVGTEADLEEFERRPWPRMLTHARLTGSDAIGNGELDVYREDTKVGSLVVTKLGKMGNRDDDQGIMAIVPANARLSVKVKTTFTTNVAVLVLYTQP